MGAYIQGVDRGQTSFQFMPLNENSAVRAIDTIVDMLDVTKHAFVHALIQNRAARERNMN